MHVSCTHESMVPQVFFQHRVKNVTRNILAHNRQQIIIITFNEYRQVQVTKIKETWYFDGSIKIISRILHFTAVSKQFKLK